MTAAPPPFHLDFGAIVPPRAAAFRAIIAEAALFFLARLAPARQAALHAAQAALPADADAAARLVRLMHACPTLHKLGQVLSRRRDLDPGLRAQLQTLESLEPRTPMADVEPTLRAELGPALERYAVRLAAQPLAEASVAVVVPFEWQPVPGGPAEHGVLKVLRPGVAAKLDEELAILAQTADFVDDRRAAHGLPDFAFRDTFETVRELLANEIHFEHEQDNLAAAAAQHADSDDVLVPRLLPLCTPRVTAMQRLNGVKVTHVQTADRALCSRLADTILRVLLADPFTSRYQAGVFHADPHAGNLLATPDGRLGLLDWSLVGRLDGHSREQLMQLILAGLTLDIAGAARALTRLASTVRSEAGVRCAAEDAVRAIRRGSFPGVDWLCGCLDSAAQAAQFPRDLLLMRKTLLIARDVVADLHAETSVDRVLVAAVVEALASDWPNRLFALPDARDFRLRLSALDVSSLLARLATVGPRYWMQSWADALAGRK